MYHMKNGKIYKDTDGTTKYQYAIFLSKEDDIAKIEGTHPLVYKNVDDMMRDLSTTEVKSWLDSDDVTIVLRKIELIAY